MEEKNLTRQARSAEVSSALEAYPALRPDGMAETMALVEQNLGNSGIDTLNLPRIKVPSGGAINWMVPTLDGETPMKEIEGIVIAWRQARLYWVKSMDEGGGGKPPDCSSTDGITGKGNPGGVCARCPNAEFGSSSKGAGQACKQIRNLLVLRPDEILPTLITVPPTSLRHCSAYFTMLLSRKVPYWCVTTRMRLEKATSSGNIGYSRMLFGVGHVLSQSERETLEPFQRQMAAMLDPSLAIDADFDER